MPHEVKAQSISEGDQKKKTELSLISAVCGKEVSRILFRHSSYADTLSGIKTGNAEVTNGCGPAG